MTTESERSKRESEHKQGGRPHLNPIPIWTETSIGSGGCCSPFLFLEFDDLTGSVQLHCCSILIAVRACACAWLASVPALPPQAPAISRHSTFALGLAGRGKSQSRCNHPLDPRPTTHPNLQLDAPEATRLSGALDLHLSITRMNAPALARSFLSK
jgi:hypothetical protein